MYQEELKTMKDIACCCFKDYLHGDSRSLIGVLDEYVWDKHFSLSYLLTKAARVFQVSRDTIEQELAREYPNYKQRWN
jgi:hypothetical protein